MTDLLPGRDCKDWRGWSPEPEWGDQGEGACDPTMGGGILMGVGGISSLIRGSSVGWNQGGLWECFFMMYWILAWLLNWMVPVDPLQWGNLNLYLPSFSCLYILVWLLIRLMWEQSVIGKGVMDDYYWLQGDWWSVLQLLLLLIVVALASVGVTQKTVASQTASSQMTRSLTAPGAVSNCI